jgi:hypothetical protein
LTGHKGDERTASNSFSWASDSQSPLARKRLITAASPKTTGIAAINASGPDVKARKATCGKYRIAKKTIVIARDRNMDLYIWLLIAVKREG